MQLGAYEQLLSWSADLESIANPAYAVFDLRKFADLAHKNRLCALLSPEAFNVADTYPQAS